MKNENLKFVINIYRLISTILLLFALSTTQVRARSLPELKVSSNKRFLVKKDGTVFFWLGDTAWSLFERLDRKGAELYLKDRAAKGFTVIQAVVGFGDKKNRYGQQAFINRDPTRPNKQYFQHVDYVVNKAESLGLYIGMLPVWGATDVRKQDRLFNASNISAARSYGRFLGNRYRDKPVIWILGGDWPAGGLEKIWQAMAEGLSEGDRGRGLITYHPRGGQTSSTWLHNESWLDMNMIQSGHSVNNRNYDMIAKDYSRKPVKPVLDGEPGYENITDGLKVAGPEVRRLRDSDVRRFAYCGVFAGATGHTYGCNEIFQFWTPGTPKPRYGALIHWKEALNLPGASQMQHLRNLIESRPMLIRIPDQSMVACDPMKTTQRIQATRGSDGSYALVYTASGKSMNIRLDRISGKTVRAYWYDPRKGTAQLIGEFSNTGTREFTPPSIGSGNDWVLVLDEAGRNFPLPGRKLSK